MAKAVLAFSTVGNDGYVYAKRADGVWFLKEGVFSSSFGWTQTKWRKAAPHDAFMIEAERMSETGGKFLAGFNTVAYVESAKQCNYRLPND